MTVFAWPLAVAETVFDLPLITAVTLSLVLSVADVLVVLVADHDKTEEVQVDI